MPAPIFSTVRRLGVLGGSFDPIHYAHLAIAEAARETLALDAVLFIPAGKAPHKRHRQTDPEHRLQMVQLAIVDHPGFYVSRMEIDREGPSYTVDTLATLHAECPHAELFFIIGADMALDFFQWRAPERILELAQVIAATRPGFALERLDAELASRQETRMTILPAPGLYIASTDLRERVRANRSLRYLTPEPVISYIAKEGLYRENNQAEG